MKETDTFLFLENSSVKDNFSFFKNSSLKEDLDIFTNEDLAEFYYITNGILLTVVGILGIAGNIMTLIILSRREMRSSINYYLIGLACFDLLLLVTTILAFGIPALDGRTDCCKFYTRYMFPYLMPYIYPLAVTAQMGSIWITVSVTVERYIAVCRPLHARSYCTYKRARIVILSISLFAFCSNLTRFWETQVVEKFDPVSNLTYNSVELTEFRTNPLYFKIYYVFFYLLVVNFIPFTILAIFNGLIWDAIQKANRERNKMSQSQYREINLAMMLVCVVAVCFMCNILSFIANILEAVQAFNDKQIMVSGRLVFVSNLLVTINSSVNFIIYCIFGKKFQSILKMLCKCSRQRSIGRNTVPETRSFITQNSFRNTSLHENMEESELR